MSTSPAVLFLTEMDVGPPEWPADLVLAGEMMSSRQGPDGQWYTFVRDASGRRWLPPDDFDWSRVVPGRVHTDDLGRRWLELDVFIVAPTTVGDQITASTRRMPVNVAAIIDDRLGDTTEMDFSMVRQLAVMHLDVRDPLEERFNAPDAPPQVPRDADADVWDLLRLSDTMAIAVAEANLFLSVRRHRLTPAEGTGFTVAFDHDTVEHQAHLLGLGRADTGMWTWSWTDPRATDPVVADLRRQGIALDIPEFTAGTVPADSGTVVHVLNAAAALTQQVATGITALANGSTAFYLIRDVPLDDPSAASITAAIESVMTSSSPVRDLRRALHQYAILRQVGHGESDQAIVLEPSDGQVVVLLDPDGSYAGIQGPSKRRRFGR